MAQRNASGASPWWYELVVGDDACEPSVGAAVAEAFASDVTITAGVAHYCSEVALRCVDIYHRHGLPIVVWGAHAAAVTDANDYPEIHRVSGVFANEDEAAAAFMRGLGYRSWAILHDPTHYGHGHAECLSRAVAARGGEIWLSREIGIDQQDFGWRGGGDPGGGGRGGRDRHGAWSVVDDPWPDGRPGSTAN